MSVPYPKDTGNVMQQVESEEKVAVSLFLVLQLVLGQLSKVTQNH